MNLLAQIIVYNNIHYITDVGCGDFWIMRNVLGFLAQNNYGYSYNGVDVVEDLVTYNNERFGNTNIKFHCIDASVPQTNLPKGDLIIIRQVLQHLNNDAVKIIMRKVNKFDYALITEHIYKGDGVAYNLDKPTDNNTRLAQRSGVYLEHSPYNYANIAHLLEMPEQGGVIRSSLIINK